MREKLLYINRKGNCSRMPLNTENDRELVGGFPQGIELSHELQMLMKYVICLYIVLKSNALLIKGNISLIRKDKQEKSSISFH